MAAVTLPEPERLEPVPGLRLAAAAAGIRYRNRDDLVLMEIAADGTTAAVFTRNSFCAAPVTVAKEHLAAGAPRYLLINAGNANAGTGEPGLVAARASCAALAEAAECKPGEVLPFSTGVIGEPLPVELIAQVLPALVAALDEEGWLRAMRAIMTTDTVGKGISRRLSFRGGEAVITGIAKGSGMIRPDMATMLSFVATDARIPRPLLERLLREAVDGSFNAITVDGDTSTNDACVVAATGRGSLEVREDDGSAVAFGEVLNEVMLHLAHAIIRDGEGATRFITIRVGGARSREEARTVAFTVANSPLVKTALFASDPNWGRILAAVGRAGLDDLDVDGVTIDIGDLRIVERGGRAASYTEEAGRLVMGEPEIAIAIDLGRGGEEATVWTCDLSFDYVRINAEYRS